MKRSHKKTPIDKVWIRKEWVHITGKNQRLVMGYLVAMTAKIKSNNHWYGTRKNDLDKVQEMWWCVLVSVHEIAKFLEKQTGNKYETCRRNAHRALDDLHALGYIMIYDESELPENTRLSLRVDQYRVNKMIEVLFDDSKDKKCFFAPRFPNLSMPGGKFSCDTGVTFCNESGVTFQGVRCDTGVTFWPVRCDTGVTFQTQNVTPDLQEYGLTEPQNPDFGGASINELININKLTNPAELLSDVGVEDNATMPAMLEPASQPQGNVRPCVFVPAGKWDQSDLHPLIRYPYSNTLSDVKTPATLKPFEEVENYGAIPELREAYHLLFRRVQEEFGEDHSDILDIGNYRRLIFPELRHDLELKFGELAHHSATYERLIEKFPGAVESAISFLKKVRDGHSDYSAANLSLRDLIIVWIRRQPRFISVHDDYNAYWGAPPIHMAFDYGVFTSQTQNSPFHRDASFEQLRITLNDAPVQLGGGTTLSPLQLSAPTLRQLIWLAGVTAFPDVTLRYLYRNFERDVLSNPKSPFHRYYQRALKAGNFSGINFFNWFKDYCQRAHYFDWQTPRVTDDSNHFLLNYPTDEATVSGDIRGELRYILTQWGKYREMYFTQMQSESWLSLRQKGMLAEKIGQV